MVEKMDPVSGSKEPQISGVGSDGIRRDSWTQSGTSVRMSSGDAVTTKDVYTVEAKDFTMDAVDFTQRQVKSVGDQQFEESAVTLSKSTFKPTVGSATNSSEQSTQLYKYSRKFAVQGGFEINLTVKDGDQAEGPGRSEGLVTKNADGTYTIATYLREGYRKERKEISPGVSDRGAYVYKSSSTCVYTPIK